MPLLLIEYELHHRHNNDREDLNIFGEEKKVGAEGRMPRKTNNPLNLNKSCTANELESKTSVNTKTITVASFDLRIKLEYRQD